MEAKNIQKLYSEEGMSAFTADLEGEAHLFIPESIVMNQDYLSNACFVHKVRGKLLERGLEAAPAVKKVRWLNLQVETEYLAMKLSPLIKTEEGECH